MSEGLPKSARDVLAKQTAADPHLSPDLLNAYVEHSLSDEENSVVLSHLAACADCREVVFLASGVAEAELLAMAQAETARVKVHVAEAVLAGPAAPRQLAREEQHRVAGQLQPPSPRRWWKWAVPAFAA